MKIGLVLLALVSLVAGDKVQGRRRSLLALEEKGEAGGRTLKGKGSKGKLDCSFRSPPVKVKNGDGVLIAKIYAIINQDKKYAKYKIVSEGGNWLAFGRSPGSMGGSQPVVAHSDGNGGMVVDMFYAFEYGVTQFMDQSGLISAKYQENSQGNGVLIYKMMLDPPDATGTDPEKFTTRKNLSNVYCVAHGDGTTTVGYHGFGNKAIVTLDAIDKCVPKSKRARYRRG